MDCIFCKIREGEIPSYKVYEDDHVLAFLDITQGTKGHTLVIPKKHVPNVYEVDEDTITHVFTAVPKIARALKKAFNPIGLNIVNNNDRPLQSVFHFHVHLIPRYEDDGMVLSTKNNFGKIEPETFIEITQKIKDSL
ncbi:HIT family protein [Candidatus Xianfuyuplasma coldseepsis]|uniref:HIT family protein n=1 Tax=Candidatus Xianfuyuplasma coldseepsis TaxID=2782163 RepID=A0A7L7KSN3_9MOLU|nr:HIT family protein [Xianfuyuplasma coldseepsis]QMS84954.1 HIT family protein [Xianfuyuplasma coldseepsis]